MIAVVGCSWTQCMFELILSSDESMRLSLVTKCSRVQWCFCLALLEQTRQPEDKGQHQSLWHVQKDTIFWSKLSNSFKDSSDLLVFYFCPFRWNDNNKNGAPATSCKIPMMQTSSSFQFIVRMFTIHGYLPSYLGARYKVRLCRGQARHSMFACLNVGWMV